MALEFITCTKCGKQQPKDNFWYCSSRQTICKFCNKKTNIIPTRYDITSDDALIYLSKIITDNELSLSVEMKLGHIFEFIKRQDCRIQELSNK